MTASGEESSKMSLRQAARDSFWLLIAVGIPPYSGWNLYQLVRPLWNDDPTPWKVLWLIALMGVSVLAARWIVLGAWRRTSWHRTRTSESPRR